MRGMRTKFLTKPELERLPTKRLLAYRDSLYAYHEGPSHEITLYGMPDLGRELHKQSPEWREAITKVKEVLATREHVPSRREVAQ